jgi:RNA polymerase sigma-70 factor, ECF subfamily
MVQNPVLVIEPPITAGEDVGLLVSRVRNGDIAAFAQLYRLHINRVYAFTARRLSGREAAEEATQEIFTRALAGIGRCRDEAAFPGWLFGIAHHVVTEQYKVARHAASPMDHQAPDPVDPGQSPEEHALHGETVEELRQARERCLSEKERILFDLLLADLTDKQIATVLGRRQGAIRTARWRLLTKLRGCLNMLSRLAGVRHAPA